MKNRGVLIFFCGKMGAGKSTMSATEAKEKNAVLLSEDDWLSHIYPNQIKNFDDYIRLSRQIRPLVGNIVKDILQTGTNVVMDFPANTLRQRNWFLNLCAVAESDHVMIYLEATNEICLKHLSIRRQEQPERSAFDTEEVFLNVTQYFEAPGESEHINVRKLEVRT